MVGRLRLVCVRLRISARRNVKLIHVADVGTGNKVSIDVGSHQFNFRNAFDNYGELAANNVATPRGSTYITIATSQGRKQSDGRPEFCDLEPDDAAGRDGRTCSGDAGHGFFRSLEIL